MAATSDTPAGPDLSAGVSPADIPTNGALAGRVGDEPVLVSRHGDLFAAVGGACTHYGAPLADGLVDGETVRCPWHHACFSLRTGAAFRAPAFDALERWKVEVEGGLVFVRSKLEAAPSPPPPPRGQDERIVIVGGGAAGFAAAERLRRLGFAGSITMLSADDAPPCDRPNLSKDYLAGEAPEEWIPLKSEAFYRDWRIDLRTGARVAAIHPAERMIVTDDGAHVVFDKLLLAMGSEPVRLAAPGFDAANVHVLRSLADARAIIAALPGAGSAAVIGASFIGLEAAAALRARGLEVHVVAPETVPMARILGSQIGAFLRSLHEAHGVAFHLGRTAALLDGKLLTLDDGSRIEADIVVVGIGVRPRTALAAEAGIATDDGILVDECLRTNVDGIYAAGDVARYPRPGSGEPIRIEHWVAAERQGQTAAANLMGQHTAHRDVPFFWSRHYDISVLYVGETKAWDELRIDGSVADGDCNVRYFEKGVHRASASIGRASDNLKEELLLESGLAGLPEAGCAAEPMSR